MAHYSGTSFATPIVSGIAVLALSAVIKKEQLPEPSALRHAILQSTIDCEIQPTSDCSKLLSGRLNVSGVIKALKRGSHEMHETAYTEPIEVNVPTVPQPDQVEASGCGCGCSGTSQPVYVIGEIDYDFSSLSRLNSLQQSMARVESLERDLNVQNRVDFGRHLCGFQEQEIIVASGMSLQARLTPNGLFVPGYAITTVEAISTGSRFAFTWGDESSDQSTLGADVTVVTQELNDIEDPLGLGFFPFFRGPLNLPIPPSRSTDVGLFADRSWHPSDDVTLSAGARVDFVSTDADNAVPDLRDTFNFPFPPITVSTLKQAGLDQSFTPWSVYLNGEYEADCDWTFVGGVGYGERPPSLTELYTAGSFIGSLQPGLTRLEGDPELQSERRLQADLGWRTEQGPFNVSLNGYYAWTWDFITYDDIDGGVGTVAGLADGSDFQRAAYTNTNFATLAGFELLGDVLLTDGLTAYGIVNYVEGFDRSRDDPSRVGTILRPLVGQPATNSRSNIGGIDTEPLPGITPLEAIVGLRLHQRCPNPAWGAELEARIVNDQYRIARTLSEIATPGFTIWNIRGFWQARENLTVIAGVENLGDKFYREHLDFRSGRGVFQPGVNFYVSTEMVY
ncbi:MAG: hypothetical protein CMJ64_08255 [Planctomycetaceae bacterium]|nr:hypothetical protein [Planctomycetaceae bacterium]